MTTIPVTEARNFWRHVERGDPARCWPWTAARHGAGYGRLKFRGGWHFASRVAYILTKGDPGALSVDHLCRNRLCCNPTHLEAVTTRENLLRGVGFPAIHAAKTHCPHGHAYDEANTYVGPKNQRWCRACRREQQRLRRQRC